MAELTYEVPKAPDHKTRSYNWKTAIGLQQVDGLVPSPYLVTLANDNIEGKLTLDEVRAKLDDYYDNKSTQSTDEERQREADLVSQRIAELLAETAFTLSPVEFLSIHKHLFEGIYDFAGALRTYNISKREWVLAGVSVEYGSARNLMETLEYDIAQEKQFDYSKLSAQETVEHFARFIANIWQVHPFGEGNTRTTAVFAIKYLRQLGYPADNTTFEEHSWYFRNALVRANFSNLQYNITETFEYLVKFFENLLLGAQHELKNKELHLDGAK